MSVSTLFIISMSFALSFTVLCFNTFANSGKLLKAISVHLIDARVA